MSEAVSETILARRPSAEPRSQDESMSMKTLSAENPADTTDESTPDRTLDLDSAHPVEVDGGDVVFVDAYVCTADGNALRFDGDQPVATAAVYSEIKLRHALADAGYDREHIEFALDTRLGGEQALAAACVAESQTHGHTAELVTDGGHDTHQATLAAGPSEQSDDDDDELCDFCGYEPGTTTPQSPDDREGFVCLECGASLEGRER